MHKKDFPIYEEFPELSYLDSAATTLRPKKLIDDLCYFLSHSGGSPHRGAHELSVRATQAYDGTRNTVKKFVHAPDDMEVIFTAGTTEAINLVARSLTKEMVANKKNILLTITAHHSNLLPWQHLAKRLGLTLEYLYITKDEHTDQELKKITEDTALVAFPLVVNATGYVHEYQKIMTHAKACNARTFVDGAQAVGHKHIDLKELDPDFFAFSAHKIYGPTGMGVLLAKKSLLEQMQPDNLGGDMIEYVEEQSATFADVPEKFEAGTQNTLGAAGLQSAIEFIEEIGIDQIIKQENEVYQYAYHQLCKEEQIEILSPHLTEGNIIAFSVNNVHPHDVASILDQYGVAIRAGHHCAQPLMNYEKLNSTCRMSLGVYNTKEDIDKLLEALRKVKEIFQC